MLVPGVHVFKNSRNNEQLVQKYSSLFVIYCDLFYLLFRALNFIKLNNFKFSVVPVSVFCVTIRTQYASDKQLIVFVSIILHLRSTNFQKFIFLMINSHNNCVLSH